MPAHPFLLIFQLCLLWYFANGVHNASRNLASPFCTHDHVVIRRVRAIFRLITICLVVWILCTYGK